MHAVKKIARVISYIFIPPTFTLLGFIYIAIKFHSDFNDQLIIILSAIIFAVILPIAFFAYFRKKKIITDNDAVIKEQRHFPFYVSIILSFFGMFFVSIFINQALATDYWLIITLNIIVVTAINYFWKISAHAIGGATFVALLYFLNNELFTFFLVLIIIVGISRYILKVHTPAQIIAGTIYGFFATLLQLHLFSGVI